MLRRRVEFSLLAYDVTWEQADVGPKHPALATPSPGATIEEREMLTRQAMDELAAVGLVHRGQVDRDLLDTWMVLARAQREYYGWFTPDGVGEHAVVVAATGPDAVIGVTDGSALALTPIRPTALVESLILALPGMEPARDRSISVPRGAVDAVLHGAEDEDGGSVLINTAGGAGRHGTVARQLADLLRRPRRGGGQFFAAWRNRLGVRIRSRRRLNYLDTTHGRTLLTEIPGTDGRSWVLAVAGDDRRFAEQLDRLSRD
ncbi:MAG: ESX secretion-associated protein EspG [Actinomycetota bacterium]|nr:ESX secretion-associated protein EspG [Actinomycetota bacterium]